MSKGKRVRSSPAIDLEKFGGQWVVLGPQDKVVSHGRDVKGLYKAASRKYKKPVLMFVPRAEVLVVTLFSI